MKIQKWFLILGAAIFLVFAGYAEAVFVLVEDFDALTAGAINGQNGWAAASSTSVVTSDPSDGLNQVLAVTTNSTHLYKNTTIPNDQARTLFLRFRFTGLQNYSFGMSDVLVPDQIGEFESELNMTNSSNDLRINNGGVYDVLALLNTDTWYNVWMFIDNQNDTTEIYLNSTMGAAATAGDKLSNTLSETVFDFRIGGTKDLVNFFIKTGGGDSGNSGPLYIDDIYLESAGSLNLSNPVPEPATLLLLGLGSAILIRKW